MLIPVYSRSWYYFEIFDFPRNGEAGGVASGTEKYYSFDYGNVHLVCLDSELTLRTPASPMWTWLAQDLAANTKDWTLVIWHSPPYSDGSHNSDYEFQLAYMRENALPILDAYGVDLVLCGHSHNYERSFLLDGHYGMSHTLTPAMIKDAGGGQVGETGAYVKAGAGSEPHQGAVYVVAGNAGWTLGANHQPSHAAMYYSALTVGSLVIDVNGNRLDAKYLNSNGDVDDEFTIIKGVTPEPLRVTAFVKDGDNVTIAWRSRVGQAYRVQRAAALASVTNWQPASPVITATGATTSWTTDEDGNPPANYYRIVEIVD